MEQHKGRNPKMKYLKGNTIAAAIALLFAAVAGTPAVAAMSMDELVAAAKAEGKLVFYSVEPDSLNDSLGAAFEAKYGIPIEFLRLTSGPLTQRFASEQEAGVVNPDLIQLVGQDIWSEKPEWFVDLSADPVPNYAEWPDQTKHVTCVDMRYSVGAITYNKDLVPADRIPTTYQDMLDPYWKDKMLLTDPRGTPAYMGWAAAVEAKYGLDFLKKIAAQNPTLVNSATPGAQQVAAGAYFANIAAHLSNSTSLRQQDAPLGVVIMADVPTGLPTCMGIVANAPHPNAAKLFIAWSLTAEATEIACERFEVGVPLPNIKNCIPLPEGWKPTDLAVMKDDALQKSIIQALGLE
jgi:iron(III) transport system substrate-binding protein